MPTLSSLQQQIDDIKARNQRVEADKAWETSWIRKILILALTYIVIVIFFFVADLKNPFSNAIVPTVGFFVSTLTGPICKRWWIRKYKK